MVAIKKQEIENVLANILVRGKVKARDQKQIYRLNETMHSGHIKHGRVIFHEIPIKLYNGVRIPRRCPQVVYNLRWHTCMSPGVTDKRKFDEKL